MQIKTKHVISLGFEGTSIWSSSFHWLYKKTYPDHKAILVINNHEPQQIELFRLNALQYKKYQKNKLSLVPSGHCSVSGCEHVNGHVLWYGQFKSQKHLRELLDAAEKLITL